MLSSATAIDALTHLILLVLSVIGGGLGSFLIGSTLSTEKTKRRTWWIRLGALEIALAILAPAVFILFCRRKTMGVFGGTDLEYFMNEMNLIKYGVLAPVFILLIYSAFAFSSILTAIAIGRLGTK